MGNTAPSQFAASIHDVARLRIRFCLDNSCLTLLILVNLVVISAIQVFFYKRTLVDTLEI